MKKIKKSFLLQWSIFFSQEDVWLYLFWDQCTLMIRHEKSYYSSCFRSLSDYSFDFCCCCCLLYHHWNTNPFMFSSCLYHCSTCAINTFFHTQLQWGNSCPLTDGELRSKGAERSFNTTVLSTETTNRVACFPRPGHVWELNPSAHSGLATTKAWAWGRSEPCPCCGV